MPVVTIFSATCCDGDAIAGEASRMLGYTLLTDEVLAAEASRASATSTGRIRRLLGGGRRFSLRPTLESARILAHLRLALAQQVAKDNIIYFGRATHFVPANISHVLRVGIAAPLAWRVQEAVTRLRISQRRAKRQIEKDDLVALRLLRAAHTTAAGASGTHDNNPWDHHLYDVRVPRHEYSVHGAASVIAEQIGRKALEVCSESREAARDFLLAARVQATLAEEGHETHVACINGDVTIALGRRPLAFDQLSQTLVEIAQGVSGVQSARVSVAPGSSTTSYYREGEFCLPERVLLVDDEAEYVMALSERLQMRAVRPTIAHSGDEALTIVETEEPDVVLLDLRMPGIDGVEVLRRLKKGHPSIEVIIITGHGTKQDEEETRQLGAFAYLQKPVDIETLSRTMQEAYEKIRRRRAQHEADRDRDRRDRHHGSGEP